MKDNPLWNHVPTRKPLKTTRDPNNTNRCKKHHRATFGQPETKKDPCASTRPQFRTDHSTGQLQPQKATSIKRSGCSRHTCNNLLLAPQKFSPPIFSYAEVTLSSPAALPKDVFPQTASIGKQEGTLAQIQSVTKPWPSPINLTRSTQTSRSNSTSAGPTSPNERDKPQKNNSSKAAKAPRHHPHQPCPAFAVLWHPTI